MMLALVLGLVIVVTVETRVDVCTLLTDVLNIVYIVNMLLITVLFTLCLLAHSGTSNYYSLFKIYFEFTACVLCKLNVVSNI